MASAHSRSFHWMLLGHAALGVVTSFWDADISLVFAGVGFVALYTSNLQLLETYFLWSPLSLIVDIVRLAVVHKVGTKVFWLFATFKTVEMIAKIGASYFGWQISSSSTEGDAGYEPMTTPQSRPDPFTPTSYSAPQDGAPPGQQQPGARQGI